MERRKKTDASPLTARCNNAVVVRERRRSIIFYTSRAPALLRTCAATIAIDRRAGGIDASRCLTPRSSMRTFGIWSHLGVDVVPTSALKAGRGSLGHRVVGAGDADFAQGQAVIKRRHPARKHGFEGG